VPGRLGSRRPRNATMGLPPWRPQWSGLGRQTAAGPWVS